MSICENCGVEHTGCYGSGRFCNNKCARAFSTKAKRKDINEKISKKFKGINFSPNRPPFSEESKQKMARSRIAYCDKNGRIPEHIVRARRAAKTRAYLARKRAAIHPDTDFGLIEKIYENRPEGYHVDHIIALSSGGWHHQDNLQYLPASENCRKSHNRSYDASKAIRWQDIMHP